MKNGFERVIDRDKSGDIENVASELLLCSSVCGKGTGGGSAESLIALGTSFL